MHRIAIFGASGASGIALLQPALQEGLAVQASCRKTNMLRQNLAALNLSTELSSQLTLIEGSPSDPKTAEKHCLSVVQGCDAVFCLLGPRPPYTDIFCEQATATIMRAMHRADVRRFFCQTGAMIGVDDTHLSWFMRTMKKRFAAQCPALAADRLAQEHIITRLGAELGITWTILKPPRLTNGKLTTRYQLAESLRITAFSSVSRRDVAHCFLKILANTNAEQFANKALLIAH